MSIRTSGAVADPEGFPDRGRWAYGPRMEAGVLGPLVIAGPSGEVPITGVKERTVLAFLVARVGQVVPADELVDALWPTDPPRTARRTLQSYVARLRTALEQGGAGAGLISTEARGYRLSIDPGDIDAHRFARLVELGRTAAADGQPAEAAGTFASALRLWRGPAYAGFEETVFGRAEGRRLNELRLTAVEDLQAARIEAGTAGAAVPELEAHTTAHPLRERGWALLVRAHAASDNQAAALGALERARRVLADELGVDPGEELRTLQTRVLAQDPTLQPRPQLPASLVPPATPMVGRTAEMAALEQHWSAVASGAGRRVLLTGEPGSGRWRLAGELAVRVHRQRAAVMLGGSPAPGRGAVLSVFDARRGAPEALVDPRPGELQLVVAAPDAGLAADAEVGTQPLDVTQVGQLVSAYLPDAEGGEVERVAVQIHARSGGNVARARELAIAWARERVAGRVADRTAASVGTVDALERQRAALAEDVLRWSALRPDQSADARVCPWRGLASYQEADAAWFAGRERLTAETVARVGAERALLLVGGSGSGKSSLLRAGLLASLAAGALPGSPGWVRVVMRPGEHPMRELTQAALAGAGSTGPDRVADLLTRSLEGRGAAERMLLVVDQLEECWTVCADPGERDAFLTTLADLAASPTIPITVVLAVRADHAGSIATHAALAGALAGRAVFVGPMGEGELRRAIEGPAARAGLALDTGLVDALVADTLAEPGGLPLLSAAMADLWGQRDGNRLTLAAYVGSGGVGAAIARMAERVYAELDEPNRKACRVLLRRLAGPGQGEAVVRRRAALAELESLPDPLVRAVVDPLAEARLLTVSDGHVEVAHEALFRAWPRLRDWLAEDDAAREVQRRLTSAAAEWDGDGREVSGLWSGARLASAVELLAARPGEFTSVEAAFVEASAARLDGERAAAEERARAASRQNTRLRRLLAGLGITLAVALLAGALAVRSGNEAAAQRETATAQRLAATAMSEDYLAPRMLTAVAGVRTQESPQTVGALLSVLAANPAIIDRIDTPNRLLGAAAAPGSDQAVAIANLEAVHVFDTVTGASRVAWSEPDANLTELRVSPDGAYAAFVKASWSGQRPPDLIVLDLTTGQIVWRRPLEDDPAVLAGGWDFTDTPGELAVATTQGIDVVRVNGSAPPRTITLDEVEPQWQQLHRAGLDRMLMLAGDTASAQLVNLATGEVSRLSEDIGARGTVSPDGRWLVTQPPIAAAAEASPVLVVDLGDPSRDPVEIPFEGDMGGAVFLPDGRSVVLGTMGGQVLVADTGTGEVRETLTGGHTGAIMGVVTSPDGTTAWTAGRDGDLIAWDLRGDRRLASVRELPLAVTTGQVSTDGRRAAVWAANPEGVPAQVGMLDLDTAELIAGPYALPDEPGERPNNFAAGLTPDGRTLLRGAVAGPDDPARLQVIDVATATIRHDVELPWWPNGIAATTDGSAALVAGVRGVVRIDLATGRIVSQIELPEVSWYAQVQATVAPSPDGRHVAVARGPRIEILDARDLRTVQTWQAGQYDDVLALQWLDDGQALAFGGRLGRLEIRTFPDGQTQVEPQQVFPGFVLDIAANPRDNLLALLGTDGEVVLWDLAAEAPVGEPLVPGLGDTSGNAWGWVRFTPDGKAVEVLYDSRRAYRYPIDTETLVARACRIAAREPTPQEWSAMHGDAPQQPLCGQPADAPLDAAG